MRLRFAIAATILGWAAPAHASPVFTSSAIEQVDGAAWYSYGVVARDSVAPGVTLTAPVLPSWLTLSTEAGWVTDTHAGGAGTRGFVDGEATVARFRNMYGVAASADGTLYVADTHNHAIRRVDGITGETTTLAGWNIPGHADGTGQDARFHYPQGIAVGPSGMVYVADAFNHCIRRIDPSTGAVTTVAGVPQVMGELDGAAADATMRFPKGIAVASNGDVYVADSGSHTIRRLDMSGMVTTVAGAVGTTGATDGIGAGARFSSPRGLGLGPDGHLYIADKDNHLVRRLNVGTGEVSTIAGTGGAGNADGVGASAAFRDPFDVAVDGSGNVFVSDSANHQIRHIDASTRAVTTIAGDGTAAFSDGLGVHAKFYFPRAITIAPSGDLFVSDRTNGSLRRLRATSAKLIGTADNSDVGLHDVRLVATSTDGFSEQTFQISVMRLNDRPMIAGMPARTVQEGLPYSFTPTASDTDGDDIVFTVAMLPAWASFNPVTGEVFGTPDYATAGRYVHVAITADDQQGADNSATTLAPFDIFVLDSNRAPVISGAPATTIAEQGTYSFTPTVVDPDTDNAHSYSGTGIPTWATLNADTGELSGTPGYEHAGTYADVAITVTDSSGGANAAATLASFAITVTNVNRAPTVAAGMADVDAYEQTALSVAIAPDAFADDDNESLTLGLTSPDGVPGWLRLVGTAEAGYSLAATPASGDAGVYNLVLVASDTAGTTAQIAFKLNVIDQLAPRLVLTAPASVANADPFLVTLAASEPLAELRPEHVSVVNGVVRDTRHDGAGVYTMRVVADGSGNVTISVPAGATTDSFGNDNLAALPVTVLYKGGGENSTGGCSAAHATGSSTALAVLLFLLFFMRRFTRLTSS